jgi:hypothetical protein
VKIAKSNVERKSQSKIFLERLRAEVAKSNNPGAEIGKTNNPRADGAKSNNPRVNIITRHLNVRWLAHKHVLVPRCKTFVEAHEPLPDLPGVEIIMKLGLLSPGVTRICKNPCREIAKVHDENFFAKKGHSTFWVVRLV